MSLQYTLIQLAMPNGAYSLQRLLDGTSLAAQCQDSMAV